MPSIVAFTGKNAFLSPIYRAAFFFEADQYLSAAAALEAAKIAKRADRVSFIGWNIKPWDAYRLGRGISTSWIRPDWSEAQLNIMKEIQRSKFSWPAQREQLMATGDATLIYGNAIHDNFWGCCQCQSLPPNKRKYGSLPGCTGNGSNWLGRILMEVREECLAGFHAKPIVPLCGPALEPQTIGSSLSHSDQQEAA